jgi:protein Mpv17
VGSAFGSPSRKTGALGASAGAGAGVVGWYLGVLDARPVLTKSVTAAAIFTVADLSSQVGIVSCPRSLI